MKQPDLPVDALPDAVPPVVHRLNIYLKAAALAGMRVSADIVDRDTYPEVVATVAKREKGQG